MGLSSAYALKMAADAAFSRGDKATGERLMRQYYTSLALAERNKIERKIKEAEAKQKAEEKRKLKEAAEKQRLKDQQKKKVK